MVKNDQNGQKSPKIAKNDQKWPKMVWNDQKWPSIGQKWHKMIQNVYENGPNEASNTNTKLPDLKWQKFPKKNTKNVQNDIKMAKNGQK